MLTSPDHEPPWRKVGNASAVLAALACGFGDQSRTACAQESSISRGLDTENPKEWSLLIRSCWADIDVCLGRIQTTCISSSQTRTATSGIEGKGLYETLSISGDTVTPSVRYHTTDETQDIGIDVINGNNVTMTQASKDPQILPVSFRQHPLGKIQVHIGQGDALQKYSAKSIWHLLLREPEICRQHLIPLLDMLIASHHLMEDADQIEKGLLQKTGQPHISRAEMTQLVSQMGNGKSEVRQHATAQLDAMGIQALPFLESMEMFTLAPEQSSRVRDTTHRMKEKYTKNGDTASKKDSVDRALLWLFEDPEIWSIFLQRADPEQQAIALRELRAMFPGKTEQELMRKYGKR